MPHPFELQRAREFLLKRSTILFGALSLALVAIKILLQFGLTDVPPPRTGGCVHLAAGVHHHQGIWVATITGAVYGLITIGMFLRHPINSPLNPGSGWDHVALPWSIPLYTFGAIFLEYLLRLDGICISFWLISIVVLRRHLRLTVFWALNLLISLYEIWPYLNPDIQAGRWDRVALSAFEPLRPEQENYGAAEYGIGMIPSVRASSRSIS